MAVTIVEIAKRAGVSHSTVSRVLNNTSDVIAKDTRERVLTIAKAMGYVPNLAARSLRDARTRMITVFSAGPGDLWRGANPTIISAAASAFLDAGYELFYSFGSSAETARLPAWRFDGAVLLDRVPDNLREQLIAQNTPYVVINDIVDEDALIVPDDAQGTEIMLDELFRLGHRKIAFVSPGAWYVGHHSIVARQAAFVAFMQHYRLPHSLVLGERVLDEDMDGWLRKQLDDGVTGLVANDHHTAITVMSAASRLGLRIPDDFSLMCFNDEFPLSILEPPVTCVRPDSELLGRTAAMYLLSLLNEKEKELAHVTRIPYQLVTRNSASAR
ncbi:MAG: LacI family DNA-binding transcriptional regulator [Armatimonadota bacterium]